MQKLTTAKRRITAFEDSAHAVLVLLASSTCGISGLPFAWKDADGKDCLVADGGITDFLPTIDALSVKIRPFSANDIFGALGEAPDVAPTEFVPGGFCMWPPGIAMLDHLYELGYRDMEARSRRHVLTSFCETSPGFCTQRNDNKEKSEQLSNASWKQEQEPKFDKQGFCGPLRASTTFVLGFQFVCCPMPAAELQQQLLQRPSQWVSSQHGRTSCHDGTRIQLHHLCRTKIALQGPGKQPSTVEFRIRAQAVLRTASVENAAGRVVASKKNHWIRSAGFRNQSPCCRQRFDNPPHVTRIFVLAATLPPQLHKRKQHQAAGARQRA